mgnify:CR=1 FL=1
MSNVQTNVRVPQDSRDLIQDIATRLRNEDGFAEKLRAWLESEQVSTGPDVQAELAELRARVEALEGARPVPALETRSAALKTESGQLTAAGRDLVFDMLVRGYSDSEAAREVDVTHASVYHRRKKWRQAGLL